MNIEELLKEFDERFGKRGPEGHSDSIGRWAGCDDCWENVHIREENRLFAIHSYDEGYKAGLKKEVTIDGKVNISKLMDLVIAEYIKVEDKPSSQS